MCFFFFVVAAGSTLNTTKPQGEFLPRTGKGKAHQAGVQKSLIPENQGGYSTWVGLSCLCCFDFAKVLVKKSKKFDPRLMWWWFFVMSCWLLFGSSFCNPRTPQKFAKVQITHLLCVFIGWYRFEILHRLVIEHWSYNFMANQPTPPDVAPPPPANKALWSGLMKTHWFPLIRPAIKPCVSAGGYVRGEVGWPAMNLSMHPR